MKMFITITALLEGLTGIALILVANVVVELLLGQPPHGRDSIVTAMLAGAAILSLAVICWILRETPVLQKLVSGMLFYNGIIIAIALVGVFWYGITSPGLWFVILSHSVLFVWGALTLMGKRDSNV